MGEASSARDLRRNRLSRAVLAIGLVASLTVASGGSAGAADSGGVDEPQTWAAPDWSYSPGEPIVDGDIVARAIGESITRDEAERRLRADRAASYLQDMAGSRWPDTFAGLWIDHDPYRVIVAFTRDATTHLTDLRAEFPYPDDVRTVDALFSLDALSILEGRLATERSLLQDAQDVPGLPEAIRATRGVYDLDIDVPTGKVVVRVTRPAPELRAAFAHRYAGPVVVQGGLAEPKACTQADCRFAMMGGLMLDVGDTYRCSSGFTASYTPDSSIRYVLAAGHCYTDTGIAKRWNGDSLYGSTTYARKSYEVDAERDRRESTGSWRESSKFFVQGETYPRTVNTVMSYSSMVIGAYVGKTGYRTGTTRGYITSKTIAPWYVPNARNFVAADMCSYEGDSGAGVWSGNTAYGIVSGGYDETYCRDTNGTMGSTFSTFGGTTVFGALSYATAALNVTILTGVNLHPTAEFTHSCSLLDCSFNGSASKDDDGGITAYTWDFGDNTVATGKTATHTYRLPGFYTVTFTTQDNNGATTATSVGITVGS